MEPSKLFHAQPQKKNSALPKLCHILIKYTSDKRFIIISTVSTTIIKEAVAPGPGGGLQGHRRRGTHPALLPGALDIHY